MRTPAFVRPPRTPIAAVPARCAVTGSTPHRPLASGSVRERGEDGRGVWGELAAHVGRKLAELLRPPVGGVARRWIEQAKETQRCVRSGPVGGGVSAVHCAGHPGRVELAEPVEDVNDLAALDAAWEEQEITFGAMAPAAPSDAPACPQAQAMVSRFLEPKEAAPAAAGSL